MSRQNLGQDNAQYGDKTAVHWRSVGFVDREAIDTVTAKTTKEAAKRIAEARRVWRCGTSKRLRKRPSRRSSWINLLGVNAASSSSTDDLEDGTGE